MKSHLPSLISLCLAAFPAVASEGGTSASQQPASRPATTTAPAASQPRTPSLGHYYNLMRYELMKDEHGNIILTTEGVEASLNEIRKAALERKEDVDQQINALAADVRTAESRRREREDRARDINLAKREQTRDLERLYKRTRGLDPAERFVINDRKRANKLDRHEDARRDTSARSEVNSMGVELRRLKEESSALQLVCSPYRQTLPPRKYWSVLSREQQNELARVGVSQKEFVLFLSRIGYTSEKFVALASSMAADLRSDPALTDQLRVHFAKLLPSAPRQNDRTEAAREPSGQRDMLLSN